MGSWRSGSGSDDDGTVVLTTSGPIRGKRLQVGSSTVTAFLGIPYAEPPVGALRFQKPIPHQPWSHVLEASSFGNMCHQSPLTGAASLDIHDGRFLAATENLIVASMNYRLGALGFLSLPPAAPGNAGLWDQRLAMCWLWDNAAAFGTASQYPSWPGFATNEGSYILYFGAPSLNLENASAIGWEELLQVVRLIVPGAPDMAIQAMARRYIQEGEKQGEAQYRWAMDQIAGDYPVLCARSGLSVPEWTGVPHGSEIPYVFGTLASVVGSNHTHGGRGSAEPQGDAVPCGVRLSG
ncbi:unnamed protein product [Caretta caretta]